MATPNPDHQSTRASPRALKRQYRETPRVMGVYVIVNLETGRLCLSATSISMRR